MVSEQEIGGMRNKNMGVLCQVGDSSIAYWYWTKKGR